MNVDELKAAMDNARNAYAEAKRESTEERNRRIREATAQIDRDMAEYFAHVGILSDAAYDARTAYEAAYVAQQNSSSITLDNGTVLKVGDVVTMMIETSWSRRWAKKVITGVVEVVSAETKFPRNMASYSKPSIGSFIVRLRTADGKIGMNIKHIQTFSPWEIAK